MAVVKDVVQFRIGNPTEVVRRMDQAASANDGAQWLNVQPWVDVEFQPKVSIFRHVFSSKGQPVPTATWVPGHTSGKEPTHTEVGIAHGAGVGAMERLREKGISAPGDWILLQQSTRRGLVWAVARGFDAQETLEFLVAACSELAEVDTDDRWLAGFVSRQ